METVAKTEEQYTQTQFLGGLRKLINAIKKRVDFVMPDRSNGLTLFHHHLPSGVCKGYALVAAKTDVSGDEESRKFFTVWAEITQLNALTSEQIIEKFAGWSMAAIMEYLHYPQEIIRNQLSKAYGKEFERPELTLSLIESTFITGSLLGNILLNKMFTAKKSLIVCDATHAMSITLLIDKNSDLAYHVNNNGNDAHRCEGYCDHFLYKLNDANNGCVIGTWEQIFKKMVEWFDLHNFDARYIALRLAVMDYEVDPQFANIIKQLQQVDPQLIDDYHAHSRVGLLHELKHQGKLKPGKIERKLLGEIYEYCNRFPTQEAMLQSCHAFRDQPTLCGHSWLHVTMMSGEPYLVQLLLDAGVDPNAGVDPTKKPIVESTEKTAGQRISKNGITGKESGYVDELENVDDDVCQEEHFGRYLSFPIHYAVVTRDLKQLTMLVEAGANVNQCAEHGETPLYLARQRHFNEIAHYLIAKGAVEYVENNFPRARQGIISLLNSPFRFTAALGRIDLDAVQLPIISTSSWKKSQVDVYTRLLDKFFKKDDEDEPPTPSNSNNL